MGMIDSTNERGGHRTHFGLRAQLAQRYAEAPPGPADTGFTRFELSVLSQNGEDGVIAELLRRIGIESRFFVEFGAEHWEGNALFLADVMGWDGLFIQSERSRCELLRYKYDDFPGIRVREAMVTSANIDDLLREARVPGNLDLLSIDIDGNDFWVWRAITAVRPRIVVIEYNGYLSPRRCLVQPNTLAHGGESEAFSGASLGALKALGEALGYTCVHAESHGVNAFFLRDDLVPALGAFDPDGVRGRRNWLDVAARRLGPIGPEGPDPRYIDISGIDRARLADRAWTGVPTSRSAQ